MNLLLLSKRGLKTCSLWFFWLLLASAATLAIADGLKDSCLDVMDDKLCWLETAD
jgi:hypothetical protein